MEKLRLFAVSSITKPPVEFSRKKSKQLYTCTLTLPVPPQLLIFHQGEWPTGESSQVTLDICLDSEKIGEMHKDSKCFNWEAGSLEVRPAGEKIVIEAKVSGVKEQALRDQVSNSKKSAGLKKKGKTLATPTEKEMLSKNRTLADMSKKMNADLDKAAVGVSGKREKVTDKTPEISVAKVKKVQPQKGKATKKDLTLDTAGRNNTTLDTAGTNNTTLDTAGKKKTTMDTAGKKKQSAPFNNVKKTRQTQLNFSCPPKVSPEISPVCKESDKKEKGKKSSTLSTQTLIDDGTKKIETGKQDSCKESEQTTIDIHEEVPCHTQAVNESTPKVADMPSPLPRKPVKQKRPRSENETPEGPTPRKRSTRMRALASESGTPKGARAIAVLNENPFKENVINPVKAAKPAKLSDGRMTRCTDLSARAPQPSARWGHTMLLTEAPCAVLIGGQGDRQQLSKDSVWTLNTETRKWRCQEVHSEGQKPEYRMGHTATYDPSMRCIYIFGGSKNSRWFHDVHVYDLDESKWTLAKVDGKAPTRAYHTATLHRHELWVFGGVYPRPDPNPDGCSNDVHIFSPVLQSWYSPIVQGEKPLPRSGHSATLIEDKMVVFGGWDAPYSHNDLHILDMTTVDWSVPDVKGTPPKPRSWHASCELSKHRILIHGGYDGDFALEDSYILDINALSWSRLVLPYSFKPRTGHTALCLPYSHESEEENEVLVFGGGDNDGEYFSDLLSFSIPFNAVVEVE